MAKKQTQEQVTEKQDWVSDTIPSEAVQSIGEEGFEDLNTPDVDGWFKPTMGALVRGKVCGSIRIPNRDRDNSFRYVVLVRLTVPCDTASLKDDGESRQVVVHPGQVLAVGISADLTKLLRCVEHRCDVIVKCIGQKDVNRPQKMWKYELKARGQLSAEVATDGGKEVSLPF